MTPFLSIWKGEVWPTTPRPRGKAGGRSCGAHAERIANRIAGQYGLSLDDLRKRSTTHGIAHPRQHAMAALHATGAYSMPAIGQFLGGLDHTTVLHGIRAHAQRIGAGA